MTFIVKRRGDTTKPIVCVYTCEEHGAFDVEVKRNERGEAPDRVACPSDAERCPACDGVPNRSEFVGGCDLCFGRKVVWCPFDATWTPSPVVCRVRRVEVTRGKYEKPERKTFLDTRNLGEGQPLEEFQAERRKMWRDVRMDRARKEFLNK